MAALDWNPGRGARQARQRLRTRGAGASWLVPMQGGTKSPFVSQMATGNNAKKYKMHRQRLNPSSPSGRSIHFGQGWLLTGQTLGPWLGLGLGLGLGHCLLALSADLDLMERNEQERLELSAEGLAEGLLRSVEEEGAVPRPVLGLAAQDHDVPHCALRGHDGAFSLLVATLGYLPDDDERAGRALGAGRLEEAARFPEGIAAPLFSASWAFWASSAAPCSERGL